MRVRMNFTIEVDVDQYNEATSQELSKTKIREVIQEACIAYSILSLQDQGVEAYLMGRNNVYDPTQRLTVAEHLVTS